MSKRKGILMIFIITIIMYISLFVTNLYMYEKTWSVSTLMYFIQLIIIIILSFLIEKTNLTSYPKQQKLVKFNMYFLILIFLAFNCFFPNIDVVLSMGFTILLLVMSCTISIFILGYVLRSFENLKEENIINNVIEEIKFTPLGIFTYIVGIFNFPEGNFILTLKCILLALGIQMIYMNLRQSFNVTSILNKEIIVLFLGTIVNLGFVIVINSLKIEWQPRNILALKDIAILISILFLIPYWKKVDNV